MASSDPTTAYGWTAFPRKVEILLASRTEATTPLPVKVADIPLPDTPLAKAIHAYAKKELASETFNHCMRVFYYGIAIAKYSFPTWNTPSFTETYFLTCLLHDIGTTDKNIDATHLSFEYYGGMIALDVVQKEGGPVAQAESVAEAIFRHQDLGETGTLTQIAALVQLATILDNMGGNPDLVRVETIESVVAAYPRNKWSSCFARVIRKENGLKPWAHSTHLGEKEFPDGSENNALMAPWD